MANFLNSSITWNEMEGILSQEVLNENKFNVSEVQTSEISVPELQISGNEAENQVDSEWTTGQLVLKEDSKENALHFDLEAKPFIKEMKIAPYSEKYRRMLMGESELKRTMRRAKQNEYREKYKKEREEALCLRNSSEKTEAEQLRQFKINRRRRPFQLEIPDHHGRLLRRKRKYRRKTAPKTKEDDEDLRELQDQVENEQPYHPSNTCISSTGHSDSSGDETADSETTDTRPRGRTAVEIFQEQGMRRLVVLVERVDKFQAVQDDGAFIH